MPKIRIDYAEDKDRLRVTLVDCIVSDDAIQYGFGWFKGMMRGSLEIIGSNGKTYRIVIPSEVENIATEFCHTDPNYTLKVERIQNETTQISG